MESDEAEQIQSSEADLLFERNCEGKVSPLWHRIY